MNVLVTGANGFVGRALCKALSLNHRVHAAVRSAPSPQNGYHRLVSGLQIAVGPTCPTTDWRPALTNQDVLIHLVARVHVMRDDSADPLADFRAVNVEGSLNLARQAAALGVKRMVFVSSIKVNGELSMPGHPFIEDEPTFPAEAYGLSKLEAEQGLHQIATETGMELVVVRPPLVYGPGVKANFAALVRAVKRGWPLPLGSVNNLRSLVGLGNLVHFLEVCANDPRAGNHTFYVSDGEDLSTPELIRRLAAAAQVKAHLIRVPVGLLKAGAALLGQRDAVLRLCGNLQVDTSKARNLLDWKPPFSVHHGLREAVLLPDQR